MRPKRHAAAVWGAGGADYDPISRSISDSIEHCVLRLAPRPGERILDLATGTGWTSRAVARQGASVIGVDIAPEVIAAARQIAEGQDLPIEYRVGDAERLPFETGAFDAVVSTCGVIFVRNPKVAAAEIARVVRPGGRLALTAWLPGGPIDAMFKVMQRYWPREARRPSGGSEEWGRPRRVREFFGGTFDLRFERGISYYREASAEAAWETFAKGHGPTKWLAANLPLEGQEAYRRDFIAFHDRFRTDVGISVPRKYHVVLGVRLPA
ncbi:MAG: class I SAM-dependent methyltransferase [Bauldia sp.]|nr:class I SAM-dependent methyltransferase [Bauldia sp.]